MSSLIRSFFLGILTAFFSLVFEVAISAFLPEGLKIHTAIKLDWLIVFSVIIEEILKYSIIYKLKFQLRENEKLIWHGFLVGLGFASTEIFLNLIQVRLDESVIYPALLGLLSIHLITTSLVGYFLSKEAADQSSHCIKIIFFTSLIHLAYNALLLYDLSYPKIYLAILILSFFIYRIHKILNHLREIRKAASLSNKNN